jgi:hypothetical protein
MPAGLVHRCSVERTALEAVEDRPYSEDLEVFAVDHKLVDRTNPVVDS